MHRAVIKSAWEQGKKRTMLVGMIQTVLVNRREARDRGRGRKGTPLRNIKMGNTGGKDKLVSP